jgi:hypothetical protein
LGRKRRKKIMRKSKANKINTLYLRTILRPQQSGSDLPSGSFAALRMTAKTCNSNELQQQQRLQHPGQLQLIANPGRHD